MYVDLDGDGGDAGGMDNVRVRVRGYSWMIDSFPNTIITKYTNINKSNN